MTALDPALHREMALESSPGRPHYLRLPEAESYENFMLLAHAFRQWRSHAETELLFRCSAVQLVILCCGALSMFVLCCADVIW